MEREMRIAARAVEEKMLSDFRQKLRQAEDLLRPYLIEIEGSGIWSSVCPERLLSEEREQKIEARISTMAEHKVSAAIVNLLATKALE